MAGVNRTHNQCIFLGNLAADPSIRTVGDGIKVANFRILVQNFPKDTGPTGINIVAWRGLADVSERMLQKGSQILFVGYYTERSYEDKDGEKRWVHEFVADSITALARLKPREENGTTDSASDSKSKEKVPEPAGADEDDLPF